MESKSTLTNTHFRFLKISEQLDPHYLIGTLFLNETSVELLRMDFLSLIKSACTHPETYTFGNPQEYVMHHRRCITLLELAYVLRCGNENFKLTEEHYLYRAGNFWFGWLLEQDSKMEYPTFHFRTLLNREINNIDIFFKDLFQFMELEEWIDTLDNILSCAYSNESYDEITDDGVRIVLILDFIEKLVEAIFLIYCLKSHDHIKKTYPEIFGD